MRYDAYSSTALIQKIWKNRYTEIVAGGVSKPAASHENSIE